MENVDFLTHAELAQALNRTVKSVGLKKLSLGLCPKMGSKSRPGDRHGKLVLIGISSTTSYRHHMWSCLCDCGKTKSISISALRTGHTTSCGCYGSGKTPITKENNAILELGEMKYPILQGLGSYKSRYNGYKQNAIKRKYDFNLSLEEFLDIARDDCAYCGSPPKPYSRYVARNGKVRAEVTPEGVVRSTIWINGVDRIDNSKGYTKDNCAPCCKVCNLAKSILTLEQFSEWIIKLIKFQMSADQL